MIICADYETPKCPPEMLAGINARFNIVLRCIGKTDQEIAVACSVTLATVRFWRRLGFPNLDCTWRLHGLAVRQNSYRFEWRAKWLRPDVRFGRAGLPLSWTGMRYVYAPHPLQFYDAPEIIDQWKLDLKRPG